MSTPANLYPGLNDLSDIFEEIPVELTKYLTLLYEIDAKCTNVLPTLTGSIDKLLNRYSDEHNNNNPDPNTNNNDDNSNDSISHNKPTLMEINTLLEELMPSLEEKMHVSSLMCELINKLDKRLELAYEVAIRNDEIPSSVRLGLDNHPAMHLHHELIQSLNNPPHSQRSTRSTQNTRNESKKDAQSNNSNNTTNNRKEKQSLSQENNNKKGTTNTSSSSSNTANNNNGGGGGGTSTTTSSKRRSNNSNNQNNGGGGSSSNANSSTSKQQKGSSKNNSKSTNGTATPTPRVNEYGEPVYCYCNQVAYGEMVGCDGENCELEWFHLPCIGLTTLPKGKWYCDTCKAKLRRSN